jgi:uncharacterized BrkB/YihY/UPF0761 family membrane protein
VFAVTGFFLIADLYIISTGDSATCIYRIQSKEIRIMKKKISVYWPLALIVPCAVIAWTHAWNTTKQQMPLAAGQLTAELARTVSYGLVGSDGDVPVKDPVKAIPAGDLSPARAI